VFTSAASCLRQANSPKYAAEMERYLRRIARVQELVPGLMFQLGEYYLQRRDPAAVQVRRNLATRYGASAARDQLDELWAKQSGR
jgi:hypothetical protein